jgi:outer membrane biosynthesis protein TonB
MTKIILNFLFVFSVFADDTLSNKSFDTPAKFKSGTQPEFTLKMRWKHSSGSVKAKLLIGKDGNVHDVIILDDMGDNAGNNVKNAIMKWHFYPATKNPRRALQNVPVMGTSKCTTPVFVKYTIPCLICS